MKREDASNYGQFYSDQAFWKKLQSLTGTGWCSLLKQVLALYVLLKAPSTSLALKVVLLGVLGYFIAPVDAIPDFTPLIGYSDDLSLIGLVLNRLGDAMTPALEREVQALLPSACR
jgi:uncharacterized membrane protein YkvA (DUF1232 family)